MYIYRLELEDMEYFFTSFKMVKNFLTIQDYEHYVGGESMCAYKKNGLIAYSQRLRTCDYLGMTEEITKD